MPLKFVRTHGPGAHPRSPCNNKLAGPDWPGLALEDMNCENHKSHMYSVRGTTRLAAWSSVTDYTMLYVRIVTLLAAALLFGFPAVPST